MSMIKYKRFSRIYKSLSQWDGYYISDKTELMICRDYMQWHFEIAGANKPSKSIYTRKVTIFVMDKSATYHLAVLNAVPDTAIHSAIEKWINSHEKEKFAAICEMWYWNGSNLVYNRKEQM